MGVFGNLICLEKSQRGGKVPNERNISDPLRKERDGNGSKNHCSTKSGGGNMGVQPTRNHGGEKKGKLFQAGRGEKEHEKETISILESKP